jgi:DNA-binding MarR family transcriptional regulator
MDAGLRQQPVAGQNGRDTGGNSVVAMAVSPSAEGQDPHETALADVARSITSARRKLGTHLEASLFANPGLDIMLFLFAEGLDGATVTTNACCAAAGVPRTTALRWIKLLQDRGLVHGSDDISDRRVTMLALSPQGRNTIRTWLDQIAALPIAQPGTPDR